MTIEQTKGFRDEVLHLYDFAMEWRYTIGFSEKAENLLKRMERFRGAEFTRKAAAKANQKLKAKVYQY